MKFVKLTLKWLSFVVALPVLIIYAVLMQGIPDTLDDLGKLLKELKNDIAKALDKNHIG